MTIDKGKDPSGSEITPESVWRNRRHLMRAAAGAGLLAMLPAPLRAGLVLEGIGKSGFSTEEAPTDIDAITGYNNFYELGTSKTAPRENAEALDTDPWSVTIDGHVARPATIALEDLVRPHALEERVYRLRCVEGWSMVIPWVGFPLKEVLRRFEPTSRAKYVRFEAIYKPNDPLPGQRYPVLDWPYVEGLRIDEAMHPLTILAVGLYGKPLPAQSGAPLRLVVPWKYGFKSIKSVVRISLVEEQPVTSWMKAAPAEYGFYSNVNPNISHPRWSQRRERRIGQFFKRPTQMFNGYGEAVAHLYQGMDLQKHF